MTKARWCAFLAGSALLLGASQAQAVVIDFDDLDPFMEVGTHYPGVTFSSFQDRGRDSRVITFAQGGTYHTSEPNIICSARNFIVNCVDDVFVDFATGVNNLTFLAVGDDQAGALADVRVFSGATLLGVVDIIGDDNPFNAPILVNLAAFADVTRIEITNMIDPAGLAYDDFSFTVGGVGGGVPEPATWAIMLLGFGGLGAMLRRSRQAGALQRA